MAYNIYVYARPDSGIEYTTVTRADTWEEQIVPMGSGNNDWYMTTISDVDGGAIFYASPCDGYKFDRFIYRIGSDEATVQESTDNPFVYEDVQNIYIRAVAIPVGSTRRIEEFDWHSSNGSASAEQTERAWRAVVNHGKIKDFSHLVWNDMVDKLAEVLTAEGYYWNSYPLTFERTKMTATDREMTADRFNAFGYNLYGVYDWNPVSRGDPIIGLTFLMMVERLNEDIRTKHQ